MDLETIVQTCTVCNEVKPLNKFHKNRTHKYGYLQMCASCRNKRNKKGKQIMIPASLDTLLTQAEHLVSTEFKGIVIRTLMMTVPLATILLNNNSNNRFKSKKFSSIWADVMAKGDWRINGDTLTIDWNGNMLDGQHRLEGVVKSGKAIPMIVVTNVDPDTFYTKDCGKPRTAKDTFDKDGLPYSTKRSSATNVFSALLSKDLYAMQSNPAWAAKYLYAIYKNDQAIFNMIDFKRNYLINDRLINGVYAYFLKYRPVDSLKIHEYFTGMFDAFAVNPNERQPIFMREWLRKNVQSNNDWGIHKTIVCLMVKSLTKHIEGCTDKSLINNKNLTCVYLH